MINFIPKLTLWSLFLRLVIEEKEEVASRIDHSEDQFKVASEEILISIKGEDHHWESKKEEHLLEQFKLLESPSKSTWVVKANSRSETSMRNKSQTMI